jgi:hypothetical protein
MARMRHKLDGDSDGDSDSKEGPGAGGPGSWLGFVKFLGLLLMITLFFMLARSMVQHHFFTGGAQNYHNSPTGP